MVGLTTLETRRLRTNMVEVYQILSGFEVKDKVQFFQRSMGSTRGRGHDWRLYKKQVKVVLEKIVSGIRVCDEWNRLPSCVDNVENVNQFKANLDHYLRENWGFK